MPRAVGEAVSTARLPRAVCAALLLAALGATAFRWPDQPSAVPKVTPARQQADERTQTADDKDGGAAARDAMRQAKHEMAHQSREMRAQLKKVREQTAAQVRAALNEARAQERAMAGPHDRQMREVQALLDGYRAARELKLDLDLEDVPVREAFRRVFRLAKQDYTIEDDVPCAPRVSLRATGIRLSTALAFLSESAGVRWSVTTSVADDSRDDAVGGSHRSQSSRDACCRFRVGREPAANLPDRAAATEALSHLQHTWLSAPGVNRAFVLAPGTFKTYRFTTAEERATFTCPHCHGQVTTFLDRQQPVCPTCGQPFQAGWDFCPNDGTRRPSTTVTWRFCPLCGKAIKIGDPCKDDKRGKSDTRKNGASYIEMDSDEEHG